MFVDIVYKVIFCLERKSRWYHVFCILFRCLTFILLTGHYSGFFAESGRNGPSFSATAPVDAGLARRYHRFPYSSGTSPAAKSQGYSGNPGVEYRGSDSDERHTRDQFLPSADDKEGRDLPLPPHTPKYTPMLLQCEMEIGLDYPAVG